MVSAACLRASRPFGATAWLLVLGIILAAPAPAWGALELTHDTFDAETAGKKIFVDFMAPECGRCVELRPKWDQLAADYEGSVYSGVYSVDCHRAGALLCKELKIGGTPDLKYGNASAGRKSLKTYSGTHKLKDLKAFAKKHLGLPCTIDAPKHCTSRDRQLIKQFEEMPVLELRSGLAAAQGSFKEREKQLRSRRSLFEEEQDLFEMELKEFKAEKKIFKKEESRFEKKVGRATDRYLERKNHEEKKRKMGEKAKDLDSRRQKLKADREASEQERWALDAEARESGLKLMQLIADSRGNALPGQFDEL